jgi:long-chain acyl-CoA synthetase
MPAAARSADPTRDAIAAADALRAKSVPLLLAERARAEPAGIAYRAKHLGVYRERTWRDYAEQVSRCAQGFAKLGVRAGDRVAIMGDAAEEWMICDLAAQALGAITYGLYPTASAGEVEYQLRDGGAVLFVAEDQEYVDKVLPLAQSLPGLANIVVIDDGAMFDYDHPLLRTYAGVIAAAERHGDAALAHLETLARAIDPTQPAFIVYTSGTTGHPKGALVSHGRHLAGTHNIVAHYPSLATAEHRTVVYLPLCHVLGRDVAVTLPLLSRLVPHFGEDLEDLPQTFFEVAPTVIFTVPRYLQKFASQVLVGMASTSSLKRAAYDAAMRIGRAKAARRWSGTRDAAGDAAYEAVRRTVFRPLLGKLGLDRLELAISGGAALPPDTMTLWQIWGVNVVEMYGQTETAGAIIAGQRGPFPRPGDVGTPPAGWEVALGADNEILVRGADLFDGYWNNPAATAEAIDADGWLHTGDVGEWRDGQLRLIDRARDFMVTSGGKTLSPSYIENALRAIPYVAEIIVFGHARKYVTALVEIDFETVSDWARANGVTYTGFTSLAEHPRVIELLAQAIEQANAQLARVEQVKAFRILPKALDPEEEGEPVTPTRKVKRKAMYERFADLVESMYDDAEERLIAASLGR